MPRYFFHVRDKDGDICRDGEGQDLPDLEAARIEAARVNREMLGEHILHGGEIDHRQIEIGDENGRTLATVALCDILLRDGQLRSFADDVTKSAPSAPLRIVGTKPAPR